MNKITTALAGAFRRKPRKRYIKNAFPGYIVYARHDITSLISDTVPGGTRGVLLTSIYRKRDQPVIVRFDGFNNQDALASDLSPHFEVGPPPVSPKRAQRRPMSAEEQAFGNVVPGAKVRTVTEYITEEPF